MKPKCIKRGGWWFCAEPLANTFYGYGATPKRAYETWQMMGRSQTIPVAPTQYVPRVEDFR